MAWSQEPPQIELQLYTSHMHMKSICHAINQLFKFSFWFKIAPIITCFSEFANFTALVKSPFLGKIFRKHLFFWKLEENYIQKCALNCDLSQQLKTRKMLVKPWIWTDKYGWQGHEHPPYLENFFSSKAEIWYVIYAY